MIKAVGGVMKYFCTAGPVRPYEHYCLDPLTRLNHKKLISLIDQEKYFVVYAPRQTGKTSMLLALMDKMNRQDRYCCVYLNVEPAQAARENVEAAMRSIVLELAGRFDEDFGDKFLLDHLETLHGYNAPHSVLRFALAYCAQKCDKPLVLMIDEIDSLVGDTLVSVLRQLRAGYTSRPANFPQSIILCGVRDVRDYRIHASSEKDPITGGSAFNVKAESLRMGNFDRKEVLSLLALHTKETGQVFTPDALESIWENSQGQPWLVNALAYEVTFKTEANRDPAVTITAEMVRQACENLILRRETHLDQLADKLREPRVHRVIAPILAGADLTTSIPDDDLAYVYDLGLVVTRPNVAIANPIYQEVIPRTLIWTSQLSITHDRTWYQNKATGQLEMDRLLEAFQQFYRENIEHWGEHQQYKEAAPQLLLQAFLQRVINGGGRIDREYGLGKGRTDLFIAFPYEQGVQRIVLELKLRKGTRQATLEKALPQISAYMDKCGATEGHVIIFDQTDAPWDDKIYHHQTRYDGYTLEVWGM